MPGDITGSTLNKRLLFATAAFSSQPGAITPNHILPTNFLFFGNGTVNFANVDSRSYTSLPTDDSHSGMPKVGAKNLGSSPPATSCTLGR